MRKFTVRSAAGFAGAALVLSAISVPALAQAPSPAKRITGLVQPLSPAIGPDGTVYITDMLNGRISVINKGATTPSRYITGLTSIIASVAVGPDGSVYLASNDETVEVVDPGASAPNPSRRINGLSNDASFLAAGADGTIYAAVEDKVEVLPPGALTPDPARTKTTAAQIGGLAVDGAGFVYTSRLIDEPLSTVIDVFKPGMAVPDASLAKTGSLVFVASGGNPLAATKEGFLYALTTPGPGDPYTVKVYRPGAKTPDTSMTLTGLPASAVGAGMGGIAVGPRTEVVVAIFGQGLGTSATVYDPASPGAPRKPTATSGAAKATISIVPSATGGVVTSYTARSVEQPSKFCTSTAAAKRCTITGLASGSFTFRVTATGPGGTSAPSPVSNRITLGGGGAPAISAASVTGRGAKARVRLAGTTPRSSQTVWIYRAQTSRGWATAIASTTSRNGRWAVANLALRGSVGYFCALSGNRFSDTVRVTRSGAVSRISGPASRARAIHTRGDIATCR